MTKNMTEGEPARLIFFFALPLVAGNMMQQLYAFIDTLIVGRFLGVNALYTNTYFLQEKLRIFVTRYLE